MDSLLCHIVPELVFFLVALVHGVEEVDLLWIVHKLSVQSLVKLVSHVLDHGQLPER